MFRNFDVFLCICACWSLATAISRRRYGYRTKQNYGTCGAPRGLTHVRFPDVRKLLTLDEFEENLVGNTINEVYFSFDRSGDLEPLLGYEIEFTEIDGTNSYTQNSRGKRENPFPECVRQEFTLTPLRPFDRAFFDRDGIMNGGNSTFAVWSSCPSSYIIYISCDEGNLVQGRCPIGSTFIAFNILGDSLDDILWDSMLNDLCYGTGIKFGLMDLQWNFTYEAQTICDGPQPEPNA